MAFRGVRTSFFSVCGPLPGLLCVFVGVLLVSCFAHAASKEDFHPILVAPATSEHPLVVAPVSRTDQATFKALVSREHHPTLYDAFHGDAEGFDAEGVPYRIDLFNQGRDPVVVTDVWLSKSSEEEGQKEKDLLEVGVLKLPAQNGHVVVPAWITENSLDPVSVRRGTVTGYIERAGKQVYF